MFKLERIIIDIGGKFIMKFSKVLVSFAALTCLVACNNNSAPSTVSQEQFAEEAAKVEEHQYATAQARIEYSNKYTFTGLTPEQETAMRDSGDMQDLEFTEEAGFSFNGSKWLTSYNFENVEAEEALCGSIGTNVKALPLGEEAEGVQFYLNPFKVVQHMEMADEESGAKMTIDSTMVFDKFGFVTLIEANYYMYVSTTVSSITFTMTRNGYSKTTFSYADAK